MITRLTAAELGAKLKSKQVSAREVADAYLSRIDAEDEKYGAFLRHDREQIFQQADAAQSLIDSGNAKPMTGVPIAIKDNICTNGIETTCSSKILKGFVPPYDASVISHLKDDGAIIIGKTNLDEFAMGTSTETSSYQLTRNPWDTERSPGGSSGGSAASVTAEMAALSLGSDTGGSIRQPAALCGVVGFKPTYGRVSRYGLIAFASSLDQIGPFARTVEDAALLAESISGYCANDATSLKDSQIQTGGLKNGSLKGLKVALPKELFSDAIEPGVIESVNQTVEMLKREGVEFKEVSIPSIPLGVTTYYIIAPAEASSNLARFDGIRFGGRIEKGDHNESTEATRGQLFGREVKLRLMMGTYALSAGYYDAYYHRAQQIRGLMSTEFEDVMKDCDVVMSPTSPMVAFKIGELMNDPLALKMLDLCTIPANMGGFPSISIPCGFAGGLPVGMCLNGPIMGDEKLLQIAYSIEQALPEARKRPPIN